MQARKSNKTLDGKKGGKRNTTDHLDLKPADIIFANIFVRASLSRNIVLLICKNLLHLTWRVKEETTN